MLNNTGKIIMLGWKRGGLCKPWILQMLYLHMYVDVILFVMCKENHTICNVYINLTQPMFGSCFISSRTVMHTDFLIYQFARNIIRSGLCNIILHAEIENKINNVLFYSLNVYKKRVVYHFANISIVYWH
jgi:hypothetical protein